MNSRHPDPRRVWKGGPQQQVMTPLPGIPRIPRINRINRACSKKLVLEQHSFTSDDFCCPRPPPLGLLPVPVLSSEKLVLEQHSFTFAGFCCLRPPPGAAAGAGAEFREANFGATLLHFSEGRLLCVGCEHWAYLSVET